MNSGMMYTFFTKSLASWLKIAEIERWPKGGAVFSWLHEDAVRTSDFTDAYWGLASLLTCEFVALFYVSWIAIFTVSVKIAGKGKERNLPSLIQDALYYQKSLLHKCVACVLC